MEKAYIVVEKPCCCECEECSPYIVKTAFSTEELAKEYIYKILVDRSGVQLVKESTAYKEMADEFFAIHCRTIHTELPPIKS